MDIVDMFDLKGIKINEDWNFEDVVTRIKYIKDDYERILSSFLWYDLSKKYEFVREIKQQVYLLKFAEWKKDRIWKYLNGEEYLESLQGILDRNKKK